MSSNKHHLQCFPVLKKSVQIALCFLVFLVSLGGTSSCSKFSKGTDGAIQNASTALDSAVTKENKNIGVDPALVRNGDMGYSLYESNGNGNDEGVGNNQVVLNYVIEHGKCTNYCGTLFYPNEKNPDEKDEIEVLGEVADDGGLTFCGKLDNVLYTIHIKNTHNSVGLNMHKHEVEITVGEKKRDIYMIFENAGQNGD